MNIWGILLMLCASILMGVGLFYMGKSQDDGNETSPEKIGGGFALAFAILSVLVGSWFMLGRPDSSGDV